MGLGQSTVWQRLAVGRWAPGPPSRRSLLSHCCCYLRAVGLRDNKLKSLYKGERVCRQYTNGPSNESELDPAMDLALETTSSVSGQAGSGTRWTYTRLLRVTQTGKLSFLCSYARELCSQRWQWFRKWLLLTPRILSTIILGFHIVIGTYFLAEASGIKSAWTLELFLPAFLVWAGSVVLHTSFNFLPTYAFGVAPDLGVASPAKVVVQLNGPDGICDPGPDRICDPLLTPTLLPNYFILEPKRVEDTCHPLKESLRKDHFRSKNPLTPHSAILIVATASTAGRGTT